MLGLNIAQELFLVLFSILYGVMLQGLIGLGPFPLGRIGRGYVTSNGELKTHFKFCGEKSPEWLRCMWRKRVGLSFFILNFCPMIYFFCILSLLDRIPMSFNFSNIWLFLPNFIQIFFIFWSALGVFGFYRIYIAIAVQNWDNLFCDVSLKGRPLSFDARAHRLWGFFYLLPPTLALTILFCYA